MKLKVLNPFFYQLGLVLVFTSMAVAHEPRVTQNSERNEISGKTAFPKNDSFYPNLDSGVIWRNQTSGTTNPLHSVFFINNNVGWVAGDNGTVLKTINGGENWQPQTSGTNNNLWSIHFVDEDNGWVVGDLGTILKTTDGGNSWLPKNSHTVFQLISVKFANNTTGWSVGDHGIILKTTDGGDIWSQKTSGTSDPLVSVDFVDTLNGWIAAIQTSTINALTLKTTDGGETWQMVEISTFWPLSSIDFISSEIGWAVGYVGIIFKSTNSGNSWFEQTGVIPNPDILYSVNFVDEYTGWAVGNDGVIVNTTNGGDSWTIQNSGTSYLLWSVYFVKSDTGWAVGEHGTILKAVPSTSIEKEPISTGIDQANFIIYNYPNPFNLTATIQYVLPKRLKVNLKIHNILGQEIKTLVDGIQSSGIKSVVWDGTDNQGRKVNPSIYLYRIQTKNNIQIRKIIFLQ